MMWSQLFFTVFLFALLHIMVWFSANLQLVGADINYHPLTIAILLSIPITLCAFYATRVGYAVFSESLWSVRFLAFGVSYLIFPVLTWHFLGESFFTFKTIVCTLLSIIIVCIQVFL